MFENTRWSNPNYQPDFNYAERVEAARQGMPWYNIGSDIAQTIGRAGESVMQKLYTNEILKQLYGDNGGETEAAAQSAPSVTPSVVPAAPAAAPAETPAPAPAAAPAGENGAVEITTPLQGTVVRVPVKVGDSVKQGQSVCVIETLKMENDVPAPKDGVIASVLVHSGDSVKTDEVILTMN